MKLPSFLISPVAHTECLKCACNRSCCSRISLSRVGAAENTERREGECEQWQKTVTGDVSVGEILCVSALLLLLVSFLVKGFSLLRKSTASDRSSVSWGGTVPLGAFSTRLYRS